MYEAIQNTKTKSEAAPLLAEARRRGWNEGGTSALPEGHPSKPPAPPEPKHHPKCNYGDPEAIAEKARETLGGRLDLVQQMLGVGEATSSEEKELKLLRPAALAVKCLARKRLMRPDVLSASSSRFWDLLDDLCAEERTVRKQIERLEVRRRRKPLFSRDRRRIVAMEIVQAMPNWLQHWDAIRERFPPAGLAYVEISLGFADPPKERVIKDERLSAAQAFWRYHVKRWKKVLRRAVDAAEQANAVQREIESRGLPSKRTS